MKVEPAEIRKALQSPRSKKYGLRFLIAVILIGVLGFFAFPPIVKYVAVKKLSELLHRPVAIQSISINPYVMSMTVNGLDVKEREGEATFVGFDSLYVNLQASSLFRWGPVIEEIRWVNPRFHVVRLAENQYNFSDLVEKFTAEPKKEDGPTPAFSLNNIQISGGVLEFDDRLVDEKHTVSDINLALPFISSMSYATDIFVEPLFSAVINGAPFELKGKSKPFSESRESEFTLALDKVELPKYFDYSPIKIPVKLASGMLDTDLAIVIGLAQTPKVTVSGKVQIKDLKVTEPAGAPLLAFKQLDVDIAAADVLASRFEIERVALDAPEITAKADREGRINWSALVPVSPAKAKPAEPAATPVEWSLGEAIVTGGSIHWADESFVKVLRAEISALEASLKNLDSKGAVADFGVALKLKAEDWFQADALSVKDGKLDLAKRGVRIGDVSAKGVRASLTRSAQGRIERIEPVPEKTGRTLVRSEAPPWTVDMAKVAGEVVNLRFEDAMPGTAAVQTIENLRFELSDLSTRSGQKMGLKAAFKLNRQGDVSVDGSLIPAPLDLDLRLNAKTVPLLPTQPYFANKLNIDITRGHLSTEGRVQLRQSAAKVDDGKLSGSYTGQLTVGDFNAVDKLNSAEFTRWKSLYFGKMDMRMGPEAVSIGEVALSDFFARIIVSPEGKLNLLHLVRQEGEAKQGVVSETEGKKSEKETATAGIESSEAKSTVPITSTPSTVRPPIKIGKITLQGGNIRFTDNFVKPNYTANLRQIGGTIVGLSSEEGSQAEMNLRGSYDNVAPLNIVAKINPLAAKPALDLQADIKGIELTTLSTYSGKYAGYAIEKGKLSVFVNYKIENNELEAENRIFLDQLTFGDPVDSPEATKLPVRLAVSLLTNRAGEIDLNLPISGSLNDPQFSIGGVIVKVIVNLLTKAITSPFALLGSVVGGGEELSHVDFAPGRTALTPEAVKRLETLAKALIDRPNLKFEIEGHVNPDQDTEGLKRARLDRKIRALKREESSGKGDDDDATVAVTDKEYPALLERVYKAEKFPKPRNMIGLVQGLPVDEMEKLIFANSAVDEDDLKALGDRLARAVRDWMVERQVPADRIFLLPSKVEAGTATEEGKKTGARADFSLK